MTTDPGFVPVRYTLTCTNDPLPSPLAEPVAGPGPAVAMTRQFFFQFDAALADFLWHVDSGDTNCVQLWDGGRLMAFFYA